MPGAIVSSSVPSCVFDGQFGNCASVHFGVACGFEIRPGGRSTRMSLTLPSGSSPLLLNEKSVTPENGVEPARVSRSPGVFDLRTSALKLETPNAAEAGVAAKPISAATTVAHAIPCLKSLMQG